MGWFRGLAVSSYNFHFQKVDRGGKFSKSPSGQHYQNRQQRRIVFNVSETNAKLSSLVDSLLPTTAEVERRNEFFSRLEDMVSRKWPTAKLHLYGSCANSFGVRNSDIDVCLALEDENAVKADAIKKIADILEEESMDQVQVWSTFHFSSLPVTLTLTTS